MSTMVRAASVRFPVDPRGIPASKAARRLGLTEAEFKDVLPRLMARGFPRPDPDTGRYDLRAVDAWMDQASGLTHGAGSVQLAGAWRANFDAWKAKNATSRSRKA